MAARDDCPHPNPPPLGGGGNSAGSANKPSPAQRGREGPAKREAGGVGAAERFLAEQRAGFDAYTQFVEVYGVFGDRYRCF